MVDALVSGTSAARRGGSSPLLGTTHKAAASLQRHFFVSLAHPQGSSFNGTFSQKTKDTVKSNGKLLRHAEHLYMLLRMKTSVNLSIRPRNEKSQKLRPHNEFSLCGLVLDGGGAAPGTKRLLKYAIEALRAAANSCEPDRKGCRYDHRSWTIKQVFRPDWSPERAFNLVCFSRSVQFPKPESNPRPLPQPITHPITPIPGQGDPPYGEWCLHSPHKVRRLTCACGDYRS